MSLREPNSPQTRAENGEALPRGDEPTGVAHPTHIFKARAPAVRACPTHDNNA